MTGPGRTRRDETFRVLLRLFVRRLVDNDVISPHADRHESLAVLCGLMISLGIFATFLLSVDYLASFVQLPGAAALSALSDRFLFIAGSICLTGLGALMIWDALALEPRDGAILGPLPIAAGTITRAKLTAALLFGAVVAVSLNAVPSVLYPALLTINMRGIRGATLLQLMAAHALTVTLAGLVGFFAVLATRGAVRLLAGEGLFRRMSSPIQSALVLGLMTSLLLAPTVRAPDVRRWVADGAPVWVIKPALWCLGVNETIAGRQLLNTPVVLPPRVVSFRTGSDEGARVVYAGLLQQFAPLARRAWMSLAVLVAVALGTFLWTNRRLPDRSGDLATPSRIRGALYRAAASGAHMDPETEAGFFFALQTLARSAHHRAFVAAGLAVGLTHALVVLTGSLHVTPAGAHVPVGFFAISTGLLISLSISVRCAVAVPAAPAANWSVRLAWSGDDRRYLTGVKRAALFLIASMLVLLLPLHVALLGITAALTHSALSLLFAAAVVEVLFFSYRKLPFACSYVPLPNARFVWPASLVAALASTYLFANASRWTVSTPLHTLAGTLLLGAAVWFLTRCDRRRRREPRVIEFGERPAAGAQRLGLFDHVMGFE